MSRLLPAVLLIVIACAVAIAIAVGGDDPQTSPGSRSAPQAERSRAAQTLLKTGTGPAGSAPVPLSRWRYRSDPRDRGAGSGWARGGFGGAVVRVPFSPNAKAFAGAAGRRAYRGSVGWFAKEIEAPVAGDYAIRFESAHHRATVYVDGRRVRRHTGAYEPFTARVALAAGEHTVVVRVDWRDPERQADEGWARAWFNYGGLNRPVTIARLGIVELGALNVRTRVAAAGRRARVDIALRVRVRAGPTRTVRVRGALMREGSLVAPLDFGKVGIAAGTSRRVDTSVTVDDPDLWSPQSPARYELRIDAPGDATLKRRIGLREITWDVAGLKLNGDPLVLRGAALPPDVKGRGDALTDPDEARIVAGLRALGANATRSQLPLSESMLEQLDAAGVLVWQEIGPWEPGGQWRFETPQKIRAARDRALRTAEAGQANPSILAWTLTNEAAGQGRPGQQEYVVQTARRLHEVDPTRPVAADLWGRNLPSSDGRLFAELDAIGMTDYVGWYQELDSSDAEQDAVTEDRLARLRGLFADKPLVVTEIGAAGSDRIAGDGFGGLRFQADLLERRITTLRQDPALSGILVWSLRDYALRPDFRGGSVLDLRPGLRLQPGLNEKGLFDFDGRPKPSLAAVRRALRR